MKINYMMHYILKVQFLIQTDVIYNTLIHFKSQKRLYIDIKLLFNTLALRGFELISNIYSNT